MYRYNAPFGVAVRSGSISGNPNTVAALRVPIAPGTTITAVSFGYRQCSGYAKTGPGSTFTLAIAGSRVRG